MINSAIKLLLVEDHKLMRVGLKSLFEEQDGLEVTSEAQSGHEAIEKFKTTHPDVTLMDIGLPDMLGIEDTKRILELNTNAKVIMLTSHLSEQEVLNSLQTCAFAVWAEIVSASAISLFDLPSTTSFKTSYSLCVRFECCSLNIARDICRCGTIPQFLSLNIGTASGSIHIAPSFIVWIIIFKISVLISFIT